MYTKEEFAGIAQKAYDAVKGSIRGVDFKITGYNVQLTFLSNRGKPNNGARFEYNGIDDKPEIICPYPTSKALPIFKEKMSELLP